MASRRMPAFYSKCAACAGGQRAPEPVAGVPPANGPIKTFTLRGKDSPLYLHDGRLLTLADTVEFFNLVLSLKLTQEEKASLVAYMLTL